MHEKNTINIYKATAVLPEIMMINTKLATIFSSRSSYPMGLNTPTKNKLQNLIATYNLHDSIQDTQTYGLT